MEVEHQPQGLCHRGTVVDDQDRTHQGILARARGKGWRHARRFVGKQAIDEYLRELSEADLAEARKLLDDAKVPHETLVRTGHVASEIVQAGEQGKFDMIVLGSKGRSALKDLVIGSVAKRVIELAATPVLLVR